MIDTFAYPAVLLLLLLVPIMALYRFAPSIRRRTLGTFLFPKVDVLAEQGKTWRIRLWPVPDLLCMVAFALLVVALARPQSMTAQEVDVEGIDIYLALDMSGSMQAIDMSAPEVRQLIKVGKQPVNRFDSAVDTLKQFIQSRQHDRLGMVVFAQNAYLQFPLTLDYNTITSMLSRLRLGDINQNGTAIGNALGRAVAGLMDSDAKTKIIILITDGDRRGGNISPQRAAETAKKLDIKIFPILVGKDGPTLVPVGGKSFFGNRTRYQNRQFPINPDLLKGIAKTTGGEYYRATDAKELKEDLHLILDKFERSRLQDATNVEYQELYHPFVIWAVILLLAQYILRYGLLRRYP